MRTDWTSLQQPYQAQYFFYFQFSGDLLLRCYYPLDTPAAGSRFLARIKLGWYSNSIPIPAGTVPAAD
jgi:hypothetical protein